MAASVLIYGPVLSDVLLLSATVFFSATVIFIRALWRKSPTYVVIDGSNVMHWKDDSASLGTVQQLLGLLHEQDKVPVVWFDANVGYKVRDRYLGPGPLARILGLSPRQVFVAPKGTPADPLLLEDAQKLNATVITNDRFRDWAESHPQIAQPGFLVGGQVQGDNIKLTDGSLAEPLKEPVQQTRRHRRADRLRAKALSPRRVMWALAALPIITASTALSVYIRTSPYEPGEAVLHLAAMAGCGVAGKVGLSPANRGELGYHVRNDADGNGVACEPTEAHIVSRGQVPARRRTETTRTVGGAKFVKP
ncbi:NYN domain-containing protein [Arenibacterium sp. CAU 1754]